MDCGMRAGVAAGQRADLIARPGRTAAGQQLVGDRAEREHIRGRAPRLPGDPLRRAVRPAHRRAETDALERFDDAEAAGARFVGRDEHVAQVQRAVADAGGAREVDRAGELGQERQRLVERGRRVVPDRDVERLGGDVLFRAIRDRALDARRDRLDDGRVEQAGIGRPRQLIGKHLRLLGCNVEPEHLDRHQPIARRLVGAEHRAESANADLMQDPERAERGRWGERSGIVSGHFSMRVGPLRRSQKTYHSVARSSSTALGTTRASRVEDSHPRAGRRRFRRNKKCNTDRAILRR